MRGIIFAFLGGACITLQGVANARISQDIGTWQAAMITQLTGFIMDFIITIFVRDRNWKCNESLIERSIISTNRRFTGKYAEYI